MSRILVVANDTNTGKTWLCCEMLHRAVKENFSISPFKPVATGSRSDAILLAEATCGRVAYSEVNPVFFQAPLAPLAASLIEDKMLDWTFIDRRLEYLQSRYKYLLVEAAGGILTPLDRQSSMCDLATRWTAPVILVVPNKLGAISQTRASVEVLLSRKIEILAIVLNELPEATQVPLHHAQIFSDDSISQITRSSNLAILREILPDYKFFTSQPSDLNLLWKTIKARLTSSPYQDT